MGIPLTAGRDIAAIDVPVSPFVIVLSQRVVRALFQSSDPIGRIVSVAGWRTCEVVSVVRWGLCSTVA